MVEIDHNRLPTEGREALLRMYGEELLVALARTIISKRGAGFAPDSLRLARELVRVYEFCVWEAPTDCFHVSSTHTMDGKVCNRCLCILKEP